VFIKQYSSLGAKVAGKFTANQIADIVFDGTDFVMIDQLPYGDFGMGLIDGGAIITNANNLTATGVYRVGPSWTGSPYAGTAGENQGSIFHRSCFDDTTYELQIFQSMITDDLLFRKKASNVWQPWNTVISSANLLGNLYGIGQVGGGVVVTDADALAPTGVYTVGPSWTGSPYSGVNGLNQGSVFHRSSFSATAYAVQMFQGMTSDDIKFRRKAAGVWQPWVTVYHTGNLGPALVPTGAVSYMATTTVPNGFIKRNGAAVSRTTYAALFAVIGTTFGAGDGSTTFNVPDARGEFDRGWDDSRGIDPGRAFGSLQLDSFASHTHAQDTRTILGVAGAAAQVGGSNGTNGGVTQATGGSETRPRNVAYMAVIKY
jgi:microcystin-dependent protein